MADTVNVPVVGRLKSSYVWVGGALLVGVVGFAWISRSRSGAAVVEEPSTANTALPDGTPPTVVDSNLDLTGEGQEVLDTNAKWTIAAVEYLTSIGYDANFVGATLGKYLARRALTSNEQDVVLAAVAAKGPPPVGGPFAITSTPVPNPVPHPPAASAKPRYVTTGRWSPQHPVSYTWMASAGLIRPSGRGWVLTGRKLGPNGTTDRRYSGAPVDYERLVDMQLIRRV